MTAAELDTVLRFMEGRWFLVQKYLRKAVTALWDEWRDSKVKASVLEQQLSELREDLNVIAEENEFLYSQNQDMRASFQNISDIATDWLDADASLDDETE